MGKHGRHQKNVKKEKTKVKFKVGKTLPKGQNITDTSFKVKKILIREQLKSGSLEPVTKRNLNLKDTLSRLQHYNTNMKLDNLSGLKEILSRNHELISSNLLAILEKLADMITDKESSVRKEAISQLTFVIRKVPVTKLSPFVCLICSYMGAALSHISKDVQADALLLLDGILSTPLFPPLILTTTPASPSSSHPFDLILQGLLNQISQQKDIYNSGKHSGWERKLSVDPEAKLADSQRRVKVLQQLRSLLKSALEMRKKAQGSTIDLSKTVNWEDIVKNGGYISVIEPSYSSGHCISLPRTSTYSFNVKSSSSEPLAHGEQLKGIVTALVPMLMESWKEVGPQKEGNFSHDITLKAAELLKLILDLMFILLEAIKLCEKDSVEFSNLTQWFRNSFSKQFFGLLMPFYPFSCGGVYRKRNREGRKKQRSSSWVVEDIESLDPETEAQNEIETKIPPECIDHNLLIAQLFCSLELMRSSEKKDKLLSSPQKCLDRILKFLTSVFEDTMLCHRYEKQMSAIIWTLLMSGRTSSDQGQKVRLRNDQIEPLINSLAMCNLKECHHGKDSCVTNCLLFRLLCNILKERNLEEIHSINTLERWIVKLPEMLPLSNNQTIKVLSDIARRCNLPIFHATLKAVLPKIFFCLKTDPKYSEKTEDLKTSLALLHWVRDWDTKELMSLEDVIRRYPKETSSLIELFRTRKEYQGKGSKFSFLLDSLAWWQKFGQGRQIEC